MEGNDTVFRLRIMSMDHDSLIQFCIDLWKENTGYALRVEELQDLFQKMAKEYKKLEAERNNFYQENLRLQAALAHSEDKNILRNRDQFGRKSEKLSGLMDACPAGDPLAEDAALEGQTDDTEKQAGDIRNRIRKKFPPVNAEATGKGRKKRRTREEVIGNLPQHNHYDIDPPYLDKCYGENGWRILNWECCTTVGHVKGFDYVDNKYTPVITYKQDRAADHALVRPCSTAESRLWPKSYASPSLLADIFNARSVLHTPFYRKAKDMARSGFPVSEQVMCQWTVRAAEEFFLPVYEHLCDIVRSDRYQQGDETTLTVIRDGRKAGSTSYIWLHCTGTCSEGPAAVVYVVELTREAEHLRTFFSGVSTAPFFYLTCDAYSGYQSFEKENEGLCRLTGCFMHARRRWADALTVLPQKILTEAEDPESIIEIKALSLIGDIYKEERKLKEMMPAERQEARKTTTSPAVDAYFEFIKELDPDSPDMSERARDAVGYSMNQETYLRRFLEDGHLECDNGRSERLIKPIAIGRRNWLFYNTMKSARAGCIISSLAQTALLHEADPYYYFKYLLEKMPPVMETADRNGKLPDTSKTREVLDNMMPWSEGYRDYEKTEKERILEYLNSKGNQKEPPKFHRKPTEFSNRKAG